MGGEAQREVRSPTQRLAEFDFTFQRSVKNTVIQDLGQLEFLHAREHVIMLDPVLLHTSPAQLLVDQAGQPISSAVNP